MKKKKKADIRISIRTSSLKYFIYCIEENLPCFCFKWRGTQRGGSGAWCTASPLHLRAGFPGLAAVSVHTPPVYTAACPPLTARCTALPAGHFQHASAYVPTFPPSTTHIYSRQPDHQHQFSASHPQLIIHHSNPSTANNQQLSIHRYLQYSRLPTEISSTWED